MHKAFLFLYGPSDRSFFSGYRRLPRSLLPNSLLASLAEFSSLLRYAKVAFRLVRGQLSTAAPTPAHCIRHRRRSQMLRFESDQNFYRINKRAYLSVCPFIYGAGGRTRTGTVSLPVDFESTTSANSITPAWWKFQSRLYTTCGK